MGELPREWERVPVHYRWPDPILECRYESGVVILDALTGNEMIRSDTVADDLVDDLEKPSC